jgi:recombination protein RecA
MAKQKPEKQGNDAILDLLEKKYGMGRASMDELIIVSTGSVQLDQAMEIGGTAIGKMIELFGENSSGKSTLSLHQMAEYQKAFPERKVALFDYENSFDKAYAEAIGINTNDLLIYQPDSQEAGYNMILALIQKDLVSCIVIDSQTAACPKAIIDGEMGDSTIGLQARNNSKFCMKVKGLLTIHKTTLFIISQTRSNIGGYGDPTITSGGNAIKFYADARWKIWKIGDKEHEANKTTVDIVKSKIGKPFGQAKFQIQWGIGISKEREILDYAIDFGIIIQAGSWFSYGETKLGQGIEKVQHLMDDNPELYEEIREKVINKLKNSNDVKEDIQQNKKSTTKEEAI